MMGRGDRFNGQRPGFSKQDLELEQNIRRAAMQQPNMPPKPGSLSWAFHPTPLAQGHPIALPDENGNPRMHIMGGLTIPEQVAMTALTGCLAQNPGMTDAEMKSLIEKATVLGQAFAMYSRSAPPANPDPAGPQLEPGPAAPPAPESAA